MVHVRVNDLNNDFIAKNVSSLKCAKIYQNCLYVVKSVFSKESHFVCLCCPWWQIRTGKTMSKSSFNWCKGLFEKKDIRHLYNFLIFQKFKIKFFLQKGYMSCVRIPPFKKYEMKKSNRNWNINTPLVNDSLRLVVQADYSKQQSNCYKWCRPNCIWQLS